MKDHAIFFVLFFKENFFMVSYMSIQNILNMLHGCLGNGIFSVFRNISFEDEEHTDQLLWDYFWQFVQKLFDCACQLFQQMSACLVSDVYADEEAKYGGPRLVWLHMVCWLVGCTNNLSEMWNDDYIRGNKGNSSGWHSCSSGCSLCQTLW